MHENEETRNYEQDACHAQEASDEADGCDAHSADRVHLIWDCCWASSGEWGWVPVRHHGRVNGYFERNFVTSQFTIQVVGKQSRGRGGHKGIECGGSTTVLHWDEVCHTDAAYEERSVLLHDHVCYVHDDHRVRLGDAAHDGSHHSAEIGTEELVVFCFSRCNAIHDLYDKLNMRNISWYR